VAVVRHHSGDPAKLVCPSEPESVVAWIGRLEEPTTPGTCASRRLARALMEGDDAPLRGIPGPSAAMVRSSNPESVWLVSDRWGLYPIYYAAVNGLLVACSRFSPLLRSGLLDWTLDRRAVLDFFTYEHVTGDRTFASPVRVLPPGSILGFADGRVEIRSYAGLPTAPGEARPTSLQEGAAHLHRQLADSVERAACGAGRVAIPLSGGLDSRALLGCALARGVPVRTYTFGDPRGFETGIAREVARLAGVPHSERTLDGRFLLDWLDHGVEVTGGMVSCTQYHILSLADVLSEEADTMLDGLGGDVLLGCNVKPDMFMTRRPESALAALHHKRATGFATEAERRQIFSPDFLADDPYDPLDALRRHFPPRGSAPPWWGSHRFDLLERQRRCLQFGPHQLRPLLRVETPFYSIPVVELATSFPLLFLFGQRAYVRMHARYLAGLAGVPDTRRHLPLSAPFSVRLGKQVLDAIRRRIAPAQARRDARESTPADYSGWFRNELRGLLGDHISGAASASGGVLRAGTAEQLLREHLEGARDHANRLGCLLTFNAWLRSIRSG